MNYTLRPAIQSDQSKIRGLIRQTRINPTGLDWRHFFVAVSSIGEIIGCGQVKLHGDSSRELASIAVIEDYRGEGIASTMINHLMNIHPKPLYLTCRANLENFYQRFGFAVIQENEMPAYFRRVNRTAKILLWIVRSKEQLLVMRV